MKSFKRSDRIKSRLARRRRALALSVASAEKIIRGPQNVLSLDTINKIVNSMKQHSLIGDFYLGLTDEASRSYENEVSGEGYTRQAAGPSARAQAVDQGADSGDDAARDGPQECEGSSDGSLEER